MAQVKIVVDSTSDIPRNLAEGLDITVVPLTVHFGDREYVDWLELAPLEFYDLLETSPHHPYTSPPTPEAFAEVYERLGADGSPVLSLHISGGLSETVRQAEAGKALVGRGEIEIIDSRVVSMACGLPAIVAARAAAGGAGLPELVSLVRGFLGRTSLFFAVDTLDYLVRNGRIGRAQAILGTLLAIKPVLTIVDGLVAPYEKVRGEKKIIPRMVEIMGQMLGSGKAGETAIVHAACLDKAIALREAVCAAFGVKDLILCDLGAVVGTHSGPGTVGMVFEKV